MKWARAWFVSLLIAAALLRTDGAEACSSSVEEMEATVTHPDLPLEAFARGRLGVLQPAYARSYLVVAYRWLAGQALSETEQNEALTLWQRRIPWVRVRAGSRPAEPDTMAPTAAQRWQTARARVEGAPVEPIATGVYDESTYEYVEWCLPDAFTSATAKLEAKLAAARGPTREIVSWARAQDDVFANCARGPLRVPSPLPVNAPAEQRAEREYQIASALFYAGRYDDAIHAFRAIAQRPGPDAALARYLVVRALQRKGDLGAAETEARAVLADPRAASVHGACAAYLNYVRFRGTPDAVRGELDAALRAPGPVSGLDAKLEDYTLLLDDFETPTLAAVPPGEPLRLWLTVVQGNGPEAFTRAHAEWSRSRDAVWLVAALMKAPGGRDARVTALLDAAAQLPRAHPGYVTARYHRARLLALRPGAGSRAAAFAELRTLASSLEPADGPSAANRVRALGAPLAPDLAGWLAWSVEAPAGVSEDGLPVQGYTSAAPVGFVPRAAQTLDTSVPIAAWARAVEAGALPANVQAQLAAVAYARALLLGDRAVASRLAPQVRTTTPALAPHVDAIEGATTDDARALSLLAMLLQHPTLGLAVRAWGIQPLDAADIESSYGLYAWCRLEAAPPDASTPAFLTRAERAQAARERTRLVALGAGPTYLAQEAVRLAARLPDDPRVPELLHRAVRLTRFGCRDDTTGAASRAAFRELHRRYPNDPWTARTPYHY